MQLSPLFAALTVTLALLAGNAHATAPQQAAAPSAAATTPAKPPVPLLWKTCRQERCVYLLGSFHMLKSDDYPLSKDVDAAFDDAERLVFEINPADLKDAATNAQAFTQAAAFSDPAMRLSTLLPAATKEKLEKLLALTGQSMEGIDKTEPWAFQLGMMIGVSQAMGFKPEQGLDMVMADRAAKAKKPVSGLETIQQQMQMLDSAPHAEQIAGLVETLDEPAKLPKSLNALHAAWRNGDMATLEHEMIADMKTKTPVSYDGMITQRNNAWIPHIEAPLNAAGSDDVLFVVGAAHLIGPEGVIKQLQDKGYTVERICSACSAPN